MTSLTGAESRLRLEIGEAWRERSKVEFIEHGAMLAMLVIWAGPFTRATGGRGVHNELVFVAAMLLVLPLIQAWRAPAGSVAFAAIVASAAVLVCVFAPAHWWGSDVAASYVLSAAAYVAARRYIRDAERRTLVASCICLAGLYEFEQAFVPWWGGGNAAARMTGSFYWHNPYAAFLLPGAILGLGLIARRRFPWSLVGWLSTPVCAAGIVFSTSRATMAALAVGWVMVLAVGVRSKSTALRLGAATVVTVGVVLALPGPPLFPHYEAPWTATETRSAGGETLSQNGEYRTQFWREAIDVAAHRPLVGSGFHELANASAMYTPSNWARSPQAHNGFLQPLSDGGLLLGLPFLAAASTLMWWSLRRLWRSLRTRSGPGDVVEVAAVVALLAMLAHSAVDFDWSHPTILVEVALLAAAIAPLADSHRVRRASGMALIVLGGTLALLVPALHQWQQSQPNLSYSTDHELGQADATFGNYRPAQAVLSDYAHGHRPLTREQAVRALRLTSSQAKVDIHMALLRDAVGASKGLFPDAVARAQATLRSIGGVLPAYVPDFALVLSGAGESQAAQDLLSRDIAAQVARGQTAPNLRLELLVWVRAFGTGESYACVRDQLRPLLRSGQDTGLPTPTQPCPRDDQGHG